VVELGKPMIASLTPRVTNRKLDTIPSRENDSVAKHYDRSSIASLRFSDIVIAQIVLKIVMIQWSHKKMIIIFYH